MNAITLHADERLRERVSRAQGVDLGAIREKAERLAAQYPTQDVAVLLAVLDHKARDGKNCRAPGSNGDQVIGIIRQGYLTTIQFRRSSQDFTPAALRVQRCLDCR